jgi:MYXO-CTERM domain-containing protein
LRFFARGQELPSGLWENVRAFFFGPDATVGEASAELLARSMDSVDQDLSEQYLEGRPSNGYGGDRPKGSGATDSWAEGQADDAVLDSLDAFAEDERFAPASRLLMIDRFATALQDPTMRVPVTGFVTDAPVSEVEAHFTKLFGVEPYPPLQRSQTELEALVMELTSLQSKAASGDQAAIKRLQELGMELQQAQQSVTIGTLLNFEAFQDHVFWVDGSADDVVSGALPRAVAVGMDPLLGRTAIRYFGGARGNGSNASDGGVALDGSVRDDRPGGRPSRDGGSGSGGDDEASAKDDGGCGLYPAARGTPVMGAWGLLALVLALRRRRRPDNA